MVDFSFPYLCAAESAGTGKRGAESGSGKKREKHMSAGILFSRGIEIHCSALKHY